MSRAKIIAAAVTVAAIFGAGWAAQGWRLNAKHAKEISQRDKEALAVAEAVKQAGIAANNAISDADKRAWKGLEDDKKELDRLRGCVAAGTCGVRLITKYVPTGGGGSDSSAGSVGHDAIDLGAEVQRRVLDLGESIGQDRRKLEYLQEYSLACWRAVQPK